MVRFLPAARMELCVLYWSAAFWKLTTSCWVLVQGFKVKVISIGIYSR